MTMREHTALGLSVAVVDCRLMSVVIGAMILRPVSDSEAVVMRLERRAGEPTFPDGPDGRDVIRHAGDDFRKKGKWRNMK